MIEAGKSYVIKIVVGLESVKFSVEVTPWQDAEPKETDVDMPFNPGYKAAYGEDGKPLVLYLYKGTEEADLDDFKVATLFEKTFSTKATRADEEAAAEYSEDFLNYYYFGNNLEYRVLKAGFAEKINKNKVTEEDPDYVKADIQKLNEETGEFEDSEESAIYFFSEKLAITQENAEESQEETEYEDIAAAIEDEVTSFDIEVYLNGELKATYTGVELSGDPITLKTTKSPIYTRTGWTFQHGNNELLIPNNSKIDGETENQLWRKTGDETMASNSFVAIIKPAE
jgi:hypothetical protein